LTGLEKWLTRMDKLVPIKIPLLNPNEPEALLSSIAASEGEAVKLGQVIAMIETTKSTGEILAERAGYLVGLCFKEGESLQAGDTLAYISASPDARDDSLPPWSAVNLSEQNGNNVPRELRITAPAKALAIKEGLDLALLPQGPLLTEAFIRSLISQSKPLDSIKRPEGDLRMVIYGVGGHGRSLAALIKAQGEYQVVGFLDDGYAPGEAVLGMEVMGGMEMLPGLVKEGIRLAVNGIGGISDPASRLKVYAQLNESGFFCPTVVHPRAFVEESAVLSDGVQVYPFAYIGTHVQIEFGCIINTGTIISHDCHLSPYVNLSPGATLAGGVMVGEEALIGMRATVNLGVKVGVRARIGNGATVKADVPDGGVVPAGTIWPPRH